MTTFSLLRTFRRASPPARAALQGLAACKGLLPARAKKISAEVGLAAEAKGDGRKTEAATQSRGGLVLRWSMRVEGEVALPSTQGFTAKSGGLLFAAHDVI
jgi:hypothetical protein